MADFTTQFDGNSMIGIIANNEDAQSWLDDNVEAEPWQFLGSMLWMDSRMAIDVLEGTLAAGFSIEDGPTGRVCDVLES